MQNSETPTIYYAYDALCGWCYGFSEVISTFHERNRHRFHFHVLSGGMVTGDRVGPVGQVAGYIKEAYLTVENTTGVKFGEDFLATLDEGSAIFTSVPAAKAMALFRSQKPDECVPFAARLQKAVYEEGLPPAEYSTYARCAADFDMDPKAFVQNMDLDKVQQLVQEEFKTVANWGIKGFPSVIYRDGEHAYMIAKGYTPLNVLEETLNNVQAEIAQKKSGA